MRAISWLGIMLVTACAPGLGSVQTWTRRTIAADLRLTDMCEGVEGAAPLMGFDGSSPVMLNRFMAAATGESGNFKLLDELAGVCPKSPSWSTYLKELTELKQSVDSASQRIRNFAKQAADFGAFADVATCAKSQMGAGASGQQSPSCDMAGADQLFNATKGLNGQFKESVAALEVQVDALLKKLPDDLKEASAGCSEPAIEQGRRAIVAYAAVASDAAHVLRWIVAFTTGDSASLYRLGRVYLAAQSDRIVDVLLTSIEDVVHRVDAELEALDKQTFGAAGAVLSAGLESGVLEEAACGVAREVRKHLTKTALPAGAFGARVCAFRRGIAGHRSRLLSTITEGLVIGAASELPCGKALVAKTGGAVALALPTASVGTFELSSPPSNRSDETLARALWSARLQAADSAWARRLASASRLQRSDLPTMDSLGLHHVAANILVQTRAGSVLSDEPDRSRRFNMEVRMVLETTLAPRPDVYGPLCLNQAAAQSALHSSNLQLVCSSLHVHGGPSPYSGELALATRQIAWELCLNRTRLDAMTKAKTICAAIRSLKKNDVHADCDDIGYGIVVQSGMTHEKGDVIDLTKDKAHWELFGGNIRLSAGSERVTVRFSGSASDLLVTDAQAFWSCAKTLPTLPIEKDSQIAPTAKGQSTWCGLSDEKRAGRVFAALRRLNKDGSLLTCNNFGSSCSAWRADALEDCKDMPSKNAQACANRLLSLARAAAPALLAMDRIGCNPSGPIKCEVWGEGEGALTLGNAKTAKAQQNFVVQVFTGGETDCAGLKPGADMPWVK